MTLLGSLRNRLLGGLGVLLLLFLGLALGAVTSLRAVNREVALELELLARGAYLTGALTGSVADQVRAGEAYLLSPSTTLAVVFMRTGDSSHAHRRAYRRVPGLTAEDQSSLNRMEANQAQMEVAYARAHALRDLGRIEEAAAAAAGARQPADDLLSDLRALTERHQRRVASRILDLRAQTDGRERLIWLLLTAAIAIGAVTAYLTVRAVQRPLVQLIAAARRFGEGDLRPMSLTAMPAELVELGQAMEAMGGRLRTIVDRLMTEAGRVRTSAGDLSGMSRQLAERGQEISEAMAGLTADADRQVREVQAADQVMSSWTAATARDEAVAERIAADGERIGTLAADQTADLSETASLLAGMRQSAGTAGGQIRAASRQVGGAAELLDLALQLAAQSEVLALNAAVEAARAGEDGGGMRAIADEARRLTETSRAAAARIGDGIALLHERIGTLDRTVQALAGQVLRAESATQQGAVILTEIARAATTIRESARLVAKAAAESRAIGTRVGTLRAGLERDVRQAVATSESVSSAAQNQAGASSEIATSAASLLETSERLAALVAEFQI